MGACEHCGRIARTQYMRGARLCAACYQEAAQQMTEERNRKRGCYRCGKETLQKAVTTRGAVVYLCKACVYEMEKK